MYAHPLRPLPWPSAFPLPAFQFEHRPVMAKRTKSKPQERGSVLFDVLYEDESRASNRRVPMEILGGLDGDEPARQLIEEQDRVISEKSGRPLRSIRSLTRSPPRAPSATDE
jgi:hypothetical protein